MALAQVVNALESLSGTVQSSLQQIAARRVEEGSPERRLKALGRLKTREQYLGQDRIIALIDEFNTVSTSVDTYLLLEKDDDLRHGWLNDRLYRKSGFPPVPPPVRPVAGATAVPE